MEKRSFITLDLILGVIGETRGFASLENISKPIYMEIIPFMIGEENVSEDGCISQILLTEYRSNVVEAIIEQHPELKEPVDVLKEWIKLQTYVWLAMSKDEETEWYIENDPDGEIYAIRTPHTSHSIREKTQSLAEKEITDMVKHLRKKAGLPVVMELTAIK